MKRFSSRGLNVAITIWLLAMACNLPIVASQATADAPTLSPQDVAGTAASIAMTAQAADKTAEPTPQPQPQQSPPTGTAAQPPTATAVPPTETPCYPMVTANTDANVRAGPGTAYDVVGYLPTNGTARVAGQNDSRTWWYIEFAGGRAWIAASVTTSSCIPAALQIVAAPPLPTAVLAPTATIVPPAAAKPDLYVSEYSWSPSPPHMGVSFHVRIGAYNQGNAPAGAFVVQWWLSTSAPSPACTWNVPSLAAHGGRILECDYTPAGWANYPSQVIVDANGSVDESDEGNNTRSQQLQIQP